MAEPVSPTTPDHLPKGSLILVAGPSGVGKDTLIDGARVALDGLRAYAFARRVITRDPEAGGEDYHPVTEPEFEQMRARGAFLHHWDAHGLRYGIPVVVRRWLEEGTHVLVNVSRAVIPEIRAVWPDTLTLLIDASPEVVAARL
ncbi:MAG: thymidine phosphorylase, partial [Celeribacter sp.]